MMRLLTKRQMTKTFTLFSFDDDRKQDVLVKSSSQQLISCFTYICVFTGFQFPGGCNVHGSEWNNCPGTKHHTTM